MKPIWLSKVCTSHLRIGRSYIADLNHIHPFPEGNGRTQRIFLCLLAKRSGFRLVDARLSRDGWLAASSDSFVQDVRRKGHFGAHQHMTALIEQALDV
jgi:fido (protein-threonine AMPylation protein)